MSNTEQDLRTELRRMLSDSFDRGYDLGYSMARLASNRPDLLTPVERTEQPKSQICDTPAGKLHGTQETATNEWPARECAYYAMHGAFCPSCESVGQCQHPGAGMDEPLPPDPALFQQSATTAPDAPRNSSEPAKAGISAAPAPEQDAPPLYTQAQYDAARVAARASAESRHFDTTFAIREAVTAYCADYWDAPPPADLNIADLVEKYGLRPLTRQLAAARVAALEEAAAVCDGYGSSRSARAAARDIRALAQSGAQGEGK